MSHLQQQKDASDAHYATIDQDMAEYSAASTFCANGNTHKLSTAMQQSLNDLQTALECPMCAKVLVRPVTLPACAHTFCEQCIDEHANNSYHCPTCQMPLTMKNTHSGKFRNINSTTQTVVNSWSKICHTLMQAEDDWWKTEPEQMDDEETSLATEASDTF